jgi:hypothetical protein
LSDSEEEREEERVRGIERNERARSTRAEYARGVRARSTRAGYAKRAEKIDRFRKPAGRVRYTRRARDLFFYLNANKVFFFRETGKKKESPSADSAGLRVFFSRGSSSARDASPLEG